MISFIWNLRQNYTNGKQINGSRKEGEGTDCSEYKGTFGGWYTWSHILIIEVMTQLHVFVKTHWIVHWQILLYVNYTLIKLIKKQKEENPSSNKYFTFKITIGPYACFHMSLDFFSFSIPANCSSSGLTILFPFYSTEHFVLKFLCSNIFPIQCLESSNSYQN